MKLKNHYIIILIVGIMFCTSLPPTWAQSDLSQPQIIKLTITPAPETSPALHYQFLPEFPDQIPGNAVPLYYQAVMMLPVIDKSEDYQDKIIAWLDLPIQDLPQEEVHTFLKSFDDMLHQLSLAAHREQCQWDFPIRSEGIEVVLPALGKFRTIARIVALKARLQTAQGDYHGAIDTLQTGFALAKHLGQGGTLIHDLVAIAITGLLLNEVQQIIQAPDSPNLYWSLAGLHPPFIDIRFSINIEKDLIYLEFPQLRDINNMRLQFQQVTEIYQKLSEALGANPDWEKKIMKPETIKLVYSQARKQLIDQGLSEEEVEQLPQAHVVILFQLKEYEQMRDEIFKWFNVPYWQARGPLKKTEQILAEKTRISEKNPTVNPFLAIFPALDHAYLTQAKLDRNIAVLRYVEAIRMYAAQHEGALPQTAAAITQVPLPIDPVTGKNFTYTRKGDTALIEGAAPPGEDISHALRIELTIKN